MDPIYKAIWRRYSSRNKLLYIKRGYWVLLTSHHHNKMLLVIIIITRLPGHCWKCVLNGEDMEGMYAYKHIIDIDSLLELDHRGLCGEDYRSRYLLLEGFVAENGAVGLSRIVLIYPYISTYIYRHIGCSYTLSYRSP